MNVDMTKPIKPYDSDPIKPAFQMPPNACDAHCHVFGPASIFPYAPGRAYTPPDAGKETLRALHDHLGITRAVIVHPSCHGDDLRVTLDAIASSDGRYRGVATVGGVVGDDELERLHQGGIRGLRFNFVAHLGGAPEIELFDRMVDRIGAIGWHVVLHLDAEDVLTYSDRLSRMTVPFVIDHMGRVRADRGLDQPAFKALLALVRNNPHAWVKICGAERVSGTGRRPFLDSVPFARRLIEAAPDRLLWGTDFPHPNIANDMPNDGELVDLIPLFTSDTDLQRQILVENPARLYWAD